MKGRVLVKRVARGEANQARFGSVLSAFESVTRCAEWGELSALGAEARGGGRTALVSLWPSTKRVTGPHEATLVEGL